MRKALSAGMLLLAMGGAAAAQGPSDATGRLDELTRCRQIADDGRRLACFDRTSAAIVDSRASGALVTLDREAVKRQATARFGLGATRKAAPPRDTPTISASVDKIAGKVALVRPAPSYGRFWIQMDNNMVWETVGPVVSVPTAGETMAIARNPFGAYRAVIGGARSIQVKRVR